MRSKQIAGIAVLVLGVILIAYGNHSSRHVLTEKSPTSHTVVSPASGDHVVKVIGSTPAAKVEAKMPHSSGRTWIVSGVILFLLGAGAFYYFGKKHGK